MGPQLCGVSTKESHARGRGANRSQRAVIEAIENRRATTRTILSQQRPRPESLAAMPTPAESFGRGSEVAGQLLQAQHICAKTLVEFAQGPLMETTPAASATQDVAETSATVTPAAAHAWRALQRLDHQGGEARFLQVGRRGVLTPVPEGSTLVTHHLHHASGLRLGLTALACGLALGAASAVAVANVLYDMVN